MVLQQRAVEAGDSSLVGHDQLAKQQREAAPKPGVLSKQQIEQVVGNVLGGMPELRDIEEPTTGAKQRGASRRLLTALSAANNDTTAHKVTQQTQLCVDPHNACQLFPCAMRVQQVLSKRKASHQHSPSSLALLQVQPQKAESKKMAIRMIRQVEQVLMGRHHIAATERASLQQQLQLTMSLAQETHNARLYQLLQTQASRLPRELASHRNKAKRSGQRSLLQLAGTGSRGHGVFGLRFVPAGQGQGSDSQATVHAKRVGRPREAETPALALLNVQKSHPRKELVEKVGAKLSMGLRSHGGGKGRSTQKKRKKQKPSSGWSNSIVDLTFEDVTKYDERDVTEEGMVLLEDADDGWATANMVPMKAVVKSQLQALSSATSAKCKVSHAKDQVTAHAVVVTRACKF